MTIVEDYVIPPDWLTFCEIDSWHPSTNYYPWSGAAKVEVVDIEDIQPPRRNPGIEAFRKYKLVPVLLAFISPECALPPVTLELLPNASGFRYRVTNGFHRFYASRAVGYVSIPAIINEAFEL
ncbi:hypothetical protein [Paraburkholderia dilworthii]|uniref:hypothetical protein n=1 Tax=Paraburkholderia dilworthii TaxID=948106 RepID=UPI0012697F6D|nr:hypothetical protein [Paraburkholderia dilworthii]